MAKIAASESKQGSNASKSDMDDTKSAADHDLAEIDEYLKLQSVFFDKHNYAVKN